jgi:hypothetical protein
LPHFDFDIRIFGYRIFDIPCWQSADCALALGLRLRRSQLAALTPS